MTRNQTIIHYAMAFSLGKASEAPVEANSIILKKHYTTSGLISFAAVPHVLGKVLKNGDQV